MPRDRAYGVELSDLRFTLRSKRMYLIVSVVVNTSSSRGVVRGNTTSQRFSSSSFRYLFIIFLIFSLMSLPNLLIRLDIRRTITTKSFPVPIDLTTRPIRVYFTTCTPRALMDSMGLLPCGEPFLIVAYLTN